MFSTGHHQCPNWNKRHSSPGEDWTGCQIQRLYTDKLCPWTGRVVGSSVSRSVGLSRRLWKSCWLQNLCCLQRLASSCWVTTPVQFVLVTDFVGFHFVQLQCLATNVHPSPVSIWAWCIEFHRECNTLKLTSAISTSTRNHGRRFFHSGLNPTLWPLLCRLLGHCSNCAQL